MAFAAHILQTTNKQAILDFDHPEIMVIGLLAVAAIPTVTGVGQAISAQKRQNAAAKDQEKFNLTVMMTMDGELREAAYCVLVDGQIFLDFPQKPVPGHKFCGYYFKYPSEEQHLGLVSTIADDPPMLNWIYVDRETHALKFGGRKATIDHLIGPWGWSPDEHFLVLQEDSQPFVTKREEDGRWALYWDPDGEMANCQSVRLRRRMLLGVESRYVRD